jgi:hypothetical protein
MFDGRPMHFRNNINTLSISASLKAEFQSCVRLSCFGEIRQKCAQSCEFLALEMTAT